MKRIITLMFLYSFFNSYPQADLALNLYFFDNSPPGYLESRVIQFGLDSTATDSIDEHLGELIYMPDECECFGWCLCAAFRIPPIWGGEGIKKDFRFGIPPYNLQTNHWVSFYATSAATEIYIAWSLPTGVTGLLRDPFGGTYINITMTDSSIYQIPSSVFGWLHDLNMTITYDNVVPVELTSFTAFVLQNEKAVQLNWTTTTETNNSGFEVERLQDYKIEKLQDWGAIGFVPGFGTTTEPKSYSFIDEDVTTGTYKYRLKQIDFDGSFEYSNEIEVEVDFTPKEFVLYQNYPNPFNPSTIIRFEIPGQARNDIVMVTLKIYDILGNEIATLVNAEKQPGVGVYEVEFSVGQDSSPDIASGIYFYQLSVGGPETSSGHKIIQTKKMILTK